MDPEPANGDRGEQHVAQRDESSAGHKRSPSGGLLSKLSFLRASAEENQTPADGPPSPEYIPGDDRFSPKKATRAMAVVVQQKTRRRKGSLRKAALLGRGAARDKRDLDASPLTINGVDIGSGDGTHSPTSPEAGTPGFGLGLGMLNPTISSGPREHTAANLPTAQPYSVLPPPLSSIASSLEAMVSSPRSPSPTLQYTSTTDEDDVLSIAKHPPLRNPSDLPLSTGLSESYFAATSLTRRRSQQSRPKSPLSLSGLSTAPPPLPDADWDYSETEWWGWVVLIVTWVVFVTGMGSCLGVWSWAWDVGETPYAPPELEDDPTLPIVGYYPALIILTGVMAWVWVVVAWVGMKYFRHARISGD